MRRPHSSFSSIDLASISQDKRPGAVLRALVDLYQSVEQNSREQQHLFTELACHLYDRADVQDRAFAARNLSGKPDAPRALLVLMANDLIAVARPVLKRAKTLRTQDYINLVQRRSSEHRVLIAERPDLDVTVIRALILSEDRPALHSLANNAAIRLPEDTTGFLVDLARSDPDLANSLTLRDDITNKDLAPAFLALNGLGRLAVIKALANEPVSPGSLVGRALPGHHTSDLLDRTSSLLSTDDVGALGHLFAERARLPLDLGHALAEDTGREGLLLILFKNRIPLDAVRSLLLTALPAENQSLDMIRHLSDVYSALTDGAVETLFHALQADGAKPAVKSKHVPVLQGHLGDLIGRPARSTKKQPGKTEQPSQHGQIVRHQK